MCPQLVATLPIAIAVYRAAPVELRPAFAKTEQRLVACQERELSTLFVESQLLHQSAIVRLHAKSQRPW